MSRSNEQLKDISDVELERLLTSTADAAPQIASDGHDHLLPFNDIPQPAKTDLDTPEAAQSWAERELIKATPRATQEMINQLRRGNAKERMEAAKQVLDRAGLVGAQKVQRQAPVVVINANVLGNLPWVKKQGSIEAKVVEALPDLTKQSNDT